MEQVYWSVKTMKNMVMGMAVMGGCLVVSAVAAESLTVTHAATPAPTYLDLGAAGDSVGDVRIWHFNGVTQLDKPVVMDWTMTTTSKDVVELGVESRVTLAVFTFGTSNQHQLIIQGVGSYPNEDSTFKPSSTLERAIIGGTGNYAGASGSVLTVHHGDGSWSHTFQFK